MIRLVTITLATLMLSSCSINHNNIIMMPNDQPSKVAGGDETHIDLHAARIEAMSNITPRVTEEGFLVDPAKIPDLPNFTTKETQSRLIVEKKLVTHIKELRELLKFQNNKILECQKKRMMELQNPNSSK